MDFEKVIYEQYMSACLNKEKFWEWLIFFRYGDRFHKWFFIVGGKERIIYFNWDVVWCVIFCVFSLSREDLLIEDAHSLTRFPREEISRHELIA